MDMEVVEDKNTSLISNYNSTEILEQAIAIYTDQMNGMKIEEIATKYNISVRTVSNRISLARKQLHDELHKVGETLRSDIFKKYERLETVLWVQWEASKDIAIIVQLRGVYSDIRKMLSLDKAGKAPSNDDGTGKEIPTLLMVMDDKAYKAKEKEYAESLNNPIIENDWEESTIDNIAK